ncbi:hypothetical protein ANCCEY_08257 [Ancylostoma ceylanicum]|uniref:Uncharacterized protein n=1 Tax=Ancylostoma ceylanicum TaxID=53326 RepID=A0A0D6LN78_9BILA|nr:hypothetical protein ANCCEY_08257 [Ancylostoma ceylanicum]
MQTQELILPGLDCPFRRMDPAIRSLFHRFHNDLRRKAVQGQFKLDGLTYRPTSDIYEVEYDCDMEGMAEQPHDFHEVNEFGINFSNIGAPWKANMVELIQGVLQSWTETDGLQQKQ